ncbi:MAG: PAS domain-containing protein [Bacteroidota bacterium]
MSIAEENRQLKEQVAQLKQQVTELRFKLNNQSSSDESALHERVKELNCLYGLSEIINKPELSMSDMLQEAVELIPPAWQYPQITCARLKMGGKDYLTKNFRETQWKQSAVITVSEKTEGNLEVFYLKRMPPKDEGPFLKEERRLINAFTQRLGKHLERRQYVRAMRESEEKQRNQEKNYRYIFENNPHPMWVYDEETLRFLDVNDTAVVKYGYTKEEFYQMTLLDIRPREEQERLRENVRTSNGRIQRSGYWKHLLKSGEVVYVEIHCHEMTYNGKKARMVIAHDVTAKKQAEEHYRILAENTSDVIWTSDLKMNITYVSPSVKQLLGEPPEVHIQRPIEEKVVTKDLEPLIQALNEELEAENQPDVNKYRSRLIELQHYRADGSIIWVEMNLKFLRDQHGFAIGILGVTRDIHERKKAELEIKDKMVQLEKFNRLMVGRENRMIELKSEVNQLLIASGSEKKYSIPSQRE